VPGTTFFLFDGPRNLRLEEIPKIVDGKDVGSAYIVTTADGKIQFPGFICDPFSITAFFELLVHSNYGDLPDTGATKSLFFPERSDNTLTPSASPDTQTTWELVSFPPLQYPQANPRPGIQDW